MPAGIDSPATFYFDLFSPTAYLVSEQLPALLAGPVSWVPVQAAGLERYETFEGFRCAEEEAIFRAEVERRAESLGLQPVVWPDPFPFDSSLAMRVATFARSIGRGRAFAQAAFRQAFAGGHSLSDPDHVLIAAAACELHPAAVSRSAKRESIANALQAATAEAAGAGVIDVPSLRIGEHLWTGEQEVRRGAESSAA